MGGKGESVEAGGWVPTQFVTPKVARELPLEWRMHNNLSDMCAHFTSSCEGLEVQE